MLLFRAWRRVNVSYLIDDCDEGLSRKIQRRYLVHRQAILSQSDGVIFHHWPLGKCQPVEEDQVRNGNQYQQGPCACIASFRADSPEWKHQQDGEE